MVSLRGSEVLVETQSRRFHSSGSFYNVHQNKISIQFIGTHHVGQDCCFSRHCCTSVQWYPRSDQEWFNHSSWGARATSGFHDICVSFIGCLCICSDFNVCLFGYLHASRHDLLITSTILLCPSHIHRVDLGANSLRRNLHIILSRCCTASLAAFLAASAGEDGVEEESREEFDKRDFESWKASANYSVVDFQICSSVEDGLIV